MCVYTYYLKLEREATFFSSLQDTYYFVEVYGISHSLSLSTPFLSFFSLSFERI